VNGNLPRVGFLGTGWIGRSRLQSLVSSNLAEVAALCDPNPEALGQAAPMAPNAQCLVSFDQLLETTLDGLVISTPSALHPAQAIQALQRGWAVFCQKPLACNAAGALAVVQCAQQVNRLLRVDLCYRHVAALRRVREVVRAGELGRVFAAELVFHNAYGPDKSWARDLQLAGGGCLIDLGVHLIDAALFVLGPHALLGAQSQLHARGVPLASPPDRVEDFATGSACFEGGTSLTLACSWQSSFGNHARIRAAFYGTEGGVAFENVSGSFYDFVCDRYYGARTERLVEGADDWSGRAIVEWARELGESSAYRDELELVEVAQVLDALYGREVVLPRASKSDYRLASPSELRAIP